MKITVSQLRRIIAEEVKRVTGAPLKEGGVVNRDSGEILDKVVGLEERLVKLEDKMDSIMWRIEKGEDRF